MLIFTLPKGGVFLFPGKEIGPGSSKSSERVVSPLGTLRVPGLSEGAYGKEVEVWREKQN